MNRILLLNASPLGEAAQGQRLARELLAALGRQHPQLTLVERDLGLQHLPPLPANYAYAVSSAAPLHDPAFEVSEALIGELEQCDALFITTPMHNFAVPAALKLWIDYVLRIHRTFAPAPDGSKHGLLGDRPVYVLVSSGGFHQGERARQPDFLTSYLRHVLNTLGLFDLHFTYLQGLAHGEAAMDNALSAARARLALEPLFRSL
ncbi:NAD(P)H-dependent oxidoreductase [Pseudomonas sp. DTU_2021_1001937_2_SI_NGA_ILE_001]|uniref:FMN-dependent NADH-azoreductase n=1 Tax=Pseudomonas sp. DTU_2021_1001937_2_SI_NGA_ILE_001 TaxID=3077589 RepID=UPI0025FF165C|nr:NAD(P)H-dependent oxidoreductase [Pseudomonas sp. DTU_2021_1001937_2_SI_NGA_ILE_001]WNW12948.1 NAD(P)H-dependent oxidoreductase [Pseudomonas sp. DTU_2021_1001937_2_SI_NGA_ILE_001]